MSFTKNAEWANALQFLELWSKGNSVVLIKVSFGCLYEKQ